MIAELGMYPFESVLPAWDALWDAIRSRAAWVPERLAHSGDVHARWSDPNCAVNHVCGWPLARTHRDDHHVIGAFLPRIAEADGYRYRSTLLSNRVTTLPELTATTTVAAVNSTDSLSGWVSLVNVTVGAHARWPGEVTITGAHRASLEALATGLADLACIDSWSLALIDRESPERVDGLHVVGHGPWIPSPAVTVRADIAEGAADDLTAAIVAAVADPDLTDAIDALLIDGFVPLSIGEYFPVLELMQDDR